MSKIPSILIKMKPMLERWKKSLMLSTLKKKNWVT